MTNQRRAIKHAATMLEPLIGSPMDPMQRYLNGETTCIIEDKRSRLEILAMILVLAHGFAINVKKHPDGLITSCVVNESIRPTTAKLPDTIYVCSEEDADSILAEIRDKLCVETSNDD